MYRSTEQQISMYELVPSDGKLNRSNRWVRLAADIDWNAFETAYRERFSPFGQVAIPARVALGSLIIQQLYNVSDRALVELVRESPYLQYFLGCETFSDEVPFSSKSLSRFRRRVPAELVQNALKRLKGYRREGKD